MSDVVNKLTDNKISLKNVIDKKTKISIHHLNLNVNLTATILDEIFGT